MIILLLGLCRVIDIWIAFLFKITARVGKKFHVVFSTGLQVGVIIMHLSFDYMSMNKKVL
jgi:hypothetical protein